MLLQRSISKSTRKRIAPVFFSVALKFQEIFPQMFYWKLPKKTCFEFLKSRIDLAKVILFGNMSKFRFPSHFCHFLLFFKLIKEISNFQQQWTAIQFILHKSLLEIDSFQEAWLSSKTGFLPIFIKGSTKIYSLKMRSQLKVTLFSFLIYF